MPDNLNIPDEALVKTLDVLDKHIGETVINPIAKELGSGVADLIHIIFGLPHFLNSPFFKDKAMQFMNELIEKKKQIPDDRLIEPDFQTVSITLENSRYCITNDELRQMFVNLICNAMDSEYSNKVHPSFPGMIKQMSTLDAKILQSFYYDRINKDDFEPILERPFCVRPIAQIIIRHGGTSFKIIYSNVFYVNISDTDYDVYKFSSSITHLEQLGLVKIDYNCWLDEENYSSAQSIIKELQDKMPNNASRLDIKKGAVILTPIGQDFLEVCIDTTASDNSAAK